MWCPRAGCETVCNLCPTKKCQPQSVHCPTCTVNFCSNCKLEWHQGLSCDEFNKQLAREGKVIYSFNPALTEDLFNTFVLFCYI